MGEGIREECKGTGTSYIPNTDVIGIKNPNILKHVI
jgi:hypothetical protein